MNEYKSIKEIISNQNPLRSRTVEFMRRNAHSINEIASVSGLSHITLNRFLNLGKNLNWPAFCKLERFIDEKTK